MDTALPIEKNIWLSSLAFDNISWQKIHVTMLSDILTVVDQVDYRHFLQKVRNFDDLLHY